MRRKRLWSGFAVFAFLALELPAQTEAENGADYKKAVYPALLGGLFVNTAFHLTSRLFGADFAQTSLDSIKVNVTSIWVWDSDGFLFNHPGHPYQGGLYHGAARASGFSFYESLFFDALGSVTWELFGETDIPALNDLIVTTYGGAVFGEILHRLYLETPSLPAGVFISPMDALINTVLRRKPQRTHNLYYFDVMSGLAYIKSNKGIQTQFNDAETASDQKNIFTFNIGCNIIYGNPFLQQSKIPFSQFEIRMQTGGSVFPLWLDWTILIDGYLVSFNPVDTPQDALSTGLSLHYDLITGSNTNFANQSLDWSVKWRRIFKTTAVELKAHLGWTFFGSSQYYPDYSGGANTDVQPMENDFGIGGDAKITFTIQTAKIGTFTFGVFAYILYMIPHNKPDSRGFDYFSLSYFEYAYPFNGRFSINVNNSFYMKNIESRHHPNSVEMANRIMLFVKLMLIDKKDGGL
jgi:hypothetical protein